MSCTPFTPNSLDTSWSVVETPFQALDYNGNSSTSERQTMITTTGLVPDPGQFAIGVQNKPTTNNVGVMQVRCVSFSNLALSPIIFNYDKNIFDPTSNLVGFKFSVLFHKVTRGNLMVVKFESKILSGISVTNPIRRTIQYAAQLFVNAATADESVLYFALDGTIDVKDQADTNFKEFFSFSNSGDVAIIWRNALNPLPIPTVSAGTLDHSIIRMDNGAKICGSVKNVLTCFNSSFPSLLVELNLNANPKSISLYQSSGNSKSSNPICTCPLPIGRFEITPGSLTITDVRTSPTALPTNTVGILTIKNTGTDCVCFDNSLHIPLAFPSGSNSAIISPMDKFCLKPTESIVVQIGLPTGATSPIAGSAILSITSVNAGTKTVTVSRVINTVPEPSDPKISVSPNPINFGMSDGINNQSKQLLISNSGAPATISFSDGNIGGFSWLPLSPTLLRKGDLLRHDVNFLTPNPALASAQLTITVTPVTAIPSPVAPVVVRIFGNKTEISLRELIIIIINVNPLGYDRPQEYIMIRNISSRPIILDGCVIKHLAFHEDASIPPDTRIFFRFPANNANPHIIHPQQNCTVYTGGVQSDDSGLLFHAAKPTPIWNNTGDTATLENREGHLIDSVTYEKGFAFATFFGLPPGSENWIFKGLSTDNLRIADESSRNPGSNTGHQGTVTRTVTFTAAFTVLATATDWVEVFFTDSSGATVSPQQDDIIRFMPNQTDKIRGGNIATRFNGPAGLDDWPLLTAQGDNWSNRPPWPYVDKPDSYQFCLIGKISSGLFDEVIFGLGIAPTITRAIVGTSLPIRIFVWTNNIFVASAPTGFFSGTVTLTRTI